MLCVCMRLADLYDIKSTVPSNGSFSSTQSSPASAQALHLSEHELDDPKAKDNLAGDSVFAALYGLLLLKHN